MTLGSLGCTARSDAGLWAMQAVSPQGFDSLHRLEQDIFVPEARRRVSLEFFLRHDNRTEEEAIPLAIELRNHHEELVYHDTLTLRLAEQKGVWLGEGLVNHELSFYAPQSIKLEYPGIYRVVLYSPAKPSPRGITLVGCRLRK